jgi:hypothetical protein
MSRYPAPLADFFACSDEEDELETQQFLHRIGAKPIVGSGRIDPEEVLRRLREEDCEPDVKRRRTAPSRPRTPAAAASGPVGGSFSFGADTDREGINDDRSALFSPSIPEQGDDGGVDLSFYAQDEPDSQHCEVERLFEQQRQDKRQSDSERWVKRRIDEENAWAAIDPANVAAAQAAMALVTQSRKDDNDVIVARVRRNFAAILPHVQEHCRCGERHWVLGNTTFAITLLFADFARKVELQAMVCGNCGASVPFNPVYIDMYPSSPAKPVCVFSLSTCCALALYSRLYVFSIGSCCSCLSKISTRLW